MQAYRFRNTPAQLRPRLPVLPQLAGAASFPRARVMGAEVSGGRFHLWASSTKLAQAPSTYDFGLRTSFVEAMATAILTEKSSDPSCIFLAFSCRKIPVLPVLGVQRRQEKWPRVWGKMEMRGSEEKKGDQRGTSTYIEKMHAKKETSANFKFENEICD